MIGDFNAIALFYIHLYAEFPNAMFLFKSPDINQDDSIGTGSLFIFYLYLHTSVLNETIFHTIAKDLQKISCN